MTNVAWMNKLMVMSSRAACTIFSCERTNIEVWYANCSNVPRSVLIFQRSPRVSPRRTCQPETHLHFFLTNQTKPNVYQEQTNKNKECEPSSPGGRSKSDSQFRPAMSNFSLLSTIIVIPLAKSKTKLLTNHSSTQHSGAEIDRSELVSASFRRCLAPDPIAASTRALGIAYDFFIR